MTGTYDAAANIVFWTARNPGPDFYGGARLGDNLYSNSVIALEENSGKRLWHFQFTPHDTHDWDAEEIPVLIDAKIRGHPRKLLLQANRNGFFYRLDRASATAAPVWTSCPPSPGGSCCAPWTRKLARSSGKRHWPAM
jgi:alcohol dehydrogenase (cytochrome c)